MADIRTVGIVGAGVIGSGIGSMPRPIATFLASVSDALRSEATMRSRIAGTVTFDSSKRNALAM